MVNPDFIKARINRVSAYYRELSLLFNFPVPEIKKDFIKRRAAERIFQLIVDEALDVNNHFIVHLKLDAPENFQSTFRILSENGILPEDFARKIAPAVGLRNRLVHRYEEIDAELFLGYLEKDRKDFEEYVRLIDEYLDRMVR